MNCTAYERNHAIAEAYHRADWSKAEDLARADRYPLATLHLFYQQSASWARHFIRPARAAN